jgi:hypothetical protein
MSKTTSLVLIWASLFTMIFAINWVVSYNDAQAELARYKTIQSCYAANHADCDKVK